MGAGIDHDRASAGAAVKTFLVVVALLLAAGPVHAQESLARRAAIWTSRASEPAADAGLQAQLPRFDRVSFLAGFWGGVSATAGVIGLIEGEAEGLPFLIGGPALAYAGAKVGGDGRAAAWGFGLGVPAVTALYVLLSGYD
jgi:hypothetical protein